MSPRSPANPAGPTTVTTVNLAFRGYGAADKPPLVLLHALGEDAGTWDDIAPALADHWRVLALDLRGHGDSDRAAEYSLARMQDDVSAFLDRHGLDHVTLVGHSTRWRGRVPPGRRATRFTPSTPPRPSVPADSGQSSSAPCVHSKVRRHLSGVGSATWPVTRTSVPAGSV